MIKDLFKTIITPTSITDVFIAAAFLFISSFFIVQIIFFVLQKLISKTKTKLDDEIFALGKPPAFFSVFLISLYLILSNAQTNLPDFVYSLILSFLIIIWVSPLVKAFDLIVKFLSTRKRGFVKPATYPLFKNVLMVVTWSFAVYFLFLVWGISLTAWLASAGIVGIAIGFAAKDTLSNLISGIFILADAPYKIGDILVLESGERGKVIEIGLRSTRIKTFDGLEITIPNSQMANSRIINETGAKIDKKIRLKIDVGICYECDPDKAEKIMLDILETYKDEILDDPKPHVRVTGFGASSIDMQLRFWVADSSYKYLLDKVRRDILQEFRKQDIEIPYNKIDVYIKK